MMKLKPFLIAVALVLLVGAGVVLAIFRTPPQDELNVVAVNDVVQTLAEQWNTLQQSGTLPDIESELDYSVLDASGRLLASTRSGLSETLNDAIAHRDTIVDIVQQDTVIGKALFYNGTAEQLQQQRHYLLTAVLIILLVLTVLCAAYVLLLNRTVFRPFRRMQSFARSVAAGNLDVPLNMDRGNLFGPFTEAFDLMRVELRKARENERKANQSKKELVASLSHDIKTPVASIKAISELMLVRAQTDKERQHLETINAKADQINLLVSNLFHATLEELQELSVHPTEEPSTLLPGLIAEADYDNRVTLAPIPDCIVLADPLRLQQVLDNVISNSYKYADTPISIQSGFTDNFLYLDIADHGAGVTDEELPLLTEKFYRAENAEGKNGSGLGLYISHYLMEQMHGQLECQNTPDGFTVRLSLAIAGRHTAK